MMVAEDPRRQCGGGGTPATRDRLGAGRHGAHLPLHGLSGNRDEMPHRFPPASERRHAYMKASWRGWCEHIAHKVARLARCVTIIHDVMMCATCEA